MFSVGLLNIGLTQACLKAEGKTADIRGVDNVSQDVGKDKIKRTAHGFWDD